MNASSAAATLVSSVTTSKMEVDSQILMEEEKQADNATSNGSIIMNEEGDSDDDNGSCAYESDYIYEDSDNEEDETSQQHYYRNRQEQEDVRLLEEVGMKRKLPPSEGSGKNAAGLKTTGLEDFQEEEEEEEEDNWTTASAAKRSSNFTFFPSPPSPSMLHTANYSYSTDTTIVSSTSSEREISADFCQTCQGEIHTPVHHCDQVQEWLDQQITVASNGVLFFAPNVMIPAMKRRLKQVLDELPHEEHQRYYENDRATGHVELQQIMRQYRWNVQAWLRPIINRDLQHQVLPVEHLDNNLRLPALPNSQRQRLLEEQRSQRVARRASSNVVNNSSSSNSSSNSSSINNNNNNSSNNYATQPTALNPPPAPAKPPTVLDAQTANSTASAPAPASTMFKRLFSFIWNEPKVNQMTCKDFMCNICMDDDVPPNERYSIGCNHVFCLDCWKSYLENQLQDATPAADFPPSCPHQTCQRRVNEKQVRFLTPHAIPKYHRLLLYPFVEGHDETMRWCPGPECDRIAVQSRDDLFIIPNNDRNDTRTRLARQQAIRELRNLRAAANNNDNNNNGNNNNNNNNNNDNDNNALVGIFNRTAHFVCCEACKTQFCFSCGEKPHPGQTCREYAAVLQGDSGSTATTATSTATTTAEAATAPATTPKEKKPRKIQKCPRCTVEIEKNGGCNHMTCKCGHQFCWLCLEDLREAHGHFCGQPNTRARVTGLVRPQLEQLDVNADYICETLEQQQEEDQDDIDDETFIEKKHRILQKLKELQRFAHYYNRFLAHGQGQHFAENQCNCLDGRANEFLLFNKLYTGTDTDFIYLSNQRLVASRRLLKYTYCYAYHNVPPDYYRHDDDEEGANVNTEHQLSNRMALFLVHQERLERVTERLSYLSENAMTRMDRRQVVDMIHTVDRCMQALKDFASEEGFASN